MPTRPKMATLGTRASDVIALDNNTHDAETTIRLNAIKEREILEDGGYGDRLQDYQGSVSIFKNEELKKTPFRIDMLFDYGDEGLNWAQGNVVELVKEKSKNIWIVKIEWDEKCVMEGEDSVTREELRRKNWNPDTHVEGVWRKDLRHLIGNLSLTRNEVESDSSVESEIYERSISGESSESEEISESEDISENEESSKSEESNQNTDSSNSESDT